MIEFPFQDAARLSAHFLRFLWSHPDYEDIHAETITAIWRQWEKHGTKWSMTTYAKVLSRQKVAEWFRSPRGRRFVSPPEGEVREDALSADFTSEVLDRVDAAAAWHFVWQRATSRQRQIMLLLYRDQLSTREAARLLGLQQSALRSTMMLALNLYRRRYDLPFKQRKGVGPNRCTK